MNFMGYRNLNHGYGFVPAPLTHFVGIVGKGS